MLTAGIAIGVAATILLTILFVTFMASVGASTMARKALQEVLEMRRHLIDRDLMGIMDETFYETEDFPLFDDETGEES
jgi:hypothetical protein